ncbi:MAG: hypothetical protein NXI28_12160 [bacterium]|nr:hypothetical protein [bacterium]
MPGRAVRAVSHARPSPSRTPERRRSTSPQTSFRERYAVSKSAEKRHQKTARPQLRERWQKLHRVLDLQPQRLNGPG